MPTATAFTALGVGNGFPFCLTKVDVSPNDYWVTLGNFNKDDSAAGNPSEADIDSSLKNAMKLLWNLNGITLDGVETDSRPSVNNYSVTAVIDGSTAVDTTPYTNDKDETAIAWINLERADDPTGFPVVKENQEPKDRACYKSGSINRLMYRADEGYTDYSSSLWYSRIIRMYDGVTTDEDNFVGYGAQLLASGGGTIYGDEWQLSLSCFAFADPLTEFALVEYVVIEGIPCVATFVNYQYYYPISDDPSYTVTLTSDSTGVTGNSSYTNVDGQGNSYTITDELKYSDLNFYAYS
jgi:hypothetical protein